MAYDKILAGRIREALGAAPQVTERAMFGGIAFMVNGNMACGVLDVRLMVRVGPDRHDEVLTQPGVQPFDMTGRPMKGWVVISPEATDSPESLRTWLNQGVNFAKSLPEK